MKSQNKEKINHYAVFLSCNFLKCAAGLHHKAEAAATWVASHKS